MPSLISRLGGRKQINGYIYASLVTVAAIPLNASFTDYALYLALGLLGTSAAVAWEDIKGRTS